MKIKNYFLGLLLSIMFLVSCNKEETTPINNKNVSIPVSKDNTVLGKKLENPFTVENMKVAYKNLENSGARIENIEIKTNYLYVRFLPQNKEEYDKFWHDETIELYDIPLDREIVREGANYKDPSLPADYPYTWYYCAVPVGFNFPAKHEILAELFIPTDDINISIDEKKSNRRYSSDLSETLVEEAMRITGNLNTESNSNARTQKYNPHGTIRVWDDIVNDFIGLHGAKVRARRWFESREGLTDQWGGFWIGESFKEDVNFSILWERSSFDIKDNTAQALYNGPKQSGAWNLDIASDKSLMFATIHRAAHDYFYSNPFPNFGSPILDGGKLSYSAKYWHDDDINADYWEGRSLFGWAEIRVFWNDRTPSNIYSTAIHETAHAHHRSISQWHFSHCDGNVAESWSRYVQWIFSNDEYQTLTGNPNFNFVGDFGVGPGFQWYTPVMGSYTPFFIDLNDDFNQKNWRRGVLQDNVIGYDYNQFIPALQQSTSLREVGGYLLDHFADNPTSGFIDEYRNQY